MAQQDIFADILKRAAAAGITSAKTADARDWFRDTAQSVTRRINEQSLVSKAPQDRLKSRILPGRLYMFSYDPKHKQELPYYDKFPVIFPIQPAKDGFLGINFHYLPHVYRARLMDALYTTASDQRMDDNTRLRISYSVLQAAAKFRYFKPCIKHYLNSHVKSRFLFVPPTEWELALFLPLERFIKANKQTVYSDVRRQLLKR